MVERKGLFHRLLTTKYVGVTIPDGVVIAGTYLLAVDMIIRGLDYLTDGPVLPTNPALVMIERVGPYSFWGWSFLVSGLVLLLGRLLGRHFVIWLGHGLSGIIYTILTIALFQGAVMAMDDWRVVSIFVIATLHLTLCFTMRPVPREWFDHRRGTSCPS